MSRFFPFGKKSASLRAAKISFLRRLHPRVCSAITFLSATLKDSATFLVVGNKKKIPPDRIQLCKFGATIGRRKWWSMKIKSFTYERNWTGKYYRQRLLPSAQTMDRHVAGMLDDGWEIISESAHSGNSRGFRLFAKRDTITVLFRKAI